MLAQPDAPMTQAIAALAVRADRGATTSPFMAGRARAMETEDLIARIYEAAVMPERWPHLLEVLAHHVGARGGTLGRHQHADPRMLCSDSIADLVAGWVAGGYHLDNQRGGQLHRDQYAGFRSDLDLLSEEERAAMPCYRDFLVPLGAHLGAGTAVDAASTGRLALTIEVFPDVDTVRTAIPVLDMLRPHLARAVVLASELQLRECRSAVEALDRAGTGAAILGERGQVIAANDAFATQLGGALLDGRDRLHLAQRTADAALNRAIHPVVASGRGASIAIRDDFGVGVAALHLIPVRRLAQEVFASASVIALVSRPAAQRAPDAPLIQALFDLTPTEASVARAIANGQSIDTLARETGKSVETVRSHLKRVFSKTATGRQNELAVLLRGFALPSGMTAG